MKKGIKVLIGFVLAIALAGSGFWLVHRFIESKEQQANFRELAESVLIEQDVSSPAPEGTPTKPSSEETMSPAQATPAPSPAPEVLHDLGALKEKNPDCTGWIRVPGTDIDYPFMWTPEDPERYLRRDFYGGYSDYGVPFLDHRCDLDSDTQTGRKESRTGTSRRQRKYAAGVCVPLPDQGYRSGGGVGVRPCPPPL